MEEQEPGTDLWYEQSRRSGTRPLDESERRRILTERIVLRIVAVLGGIATPILFLFALAGLAVLTERNNYSSSGNNGHILVMLGGLVLFALLVVVTRYSGLRSTGMRKDLAAGFVNQYQVEGQTIEVLPYSNRVWTVGGVIQPWYIGPVEQDELAVPATTSPPRETEIPDVGGVPAQPPVVATIRNLSDAEREELRRLARKRWLSGLPYAIFASFWFGIAIVFALSPGTSGQINPLFVLFHGFLAVSAIYVQVSAFLEARRLWLDWSDGRLLPSPVQGKLEERLAVSHRAWTVDGQPAPWRRKPKDMGDQFQEP